MYNYDIFLCDSLEKVFPLKRPRPMGENKNIVVFEGMIPAVQLVYFRKRNVERAPFVTPIEIKVEGVPFESALSSVELVPADYPSHEKYDEGYLSIEPGLFPDLLRPLPGGKVMPVAGQYRAVRIEFPGITAKEAGLYNVKIKAATAKEVTLENGSKARDAEAQFYAELCFTLDVKKETLPAQRITHTEWFHADCLADFYRVEILSEAHWKIIEAFIEPMAKRFAINTVLTPVFTPPLDTEPGGERPTVQLVDIEKDGGSYSFNFEKLKRWCAVCKKYGVSFIEIPHFFTQWGASYTPKIIARIKESGEPKRIFGWDVPAEDPSYAAFLKMFVPALREALKRCGYDKDHVIFHISDEPAYGMKAAYKKARDIAVPLAAGSLFVDALSDLAFYREGLVECPAAAVDHAGPFIEEGLSSLWVYYCTAQYYKVPNRFFALPLTRARAMGILIYYFKIKGFLQWGYNYYYSQNSRSLINPFCEASGIRTWPAGDPFLVYPGEDGKPLSSIRAEAQREAFEDIRLLDLVEEKAGREKAVSLVTEDFPGTLSFEHYPTDPGYYYRLREKAARLIADYRA